MRQKVVAVAVQPLRESSSAVRWISTTYASLAQSQFREYGALEPWIDAHLAYLLRRPQIASGSPADPGRRQPPSR
jgi:hypothetical protein